MKFVGFYELINPYFTTVKRFCAWRSNHTGAVSVIYAIHLSVCTNHVPATDTNCICLDGIRINQKQRSLPLSFIFLAFAICFYLLIDCYHNILSCLCYSESCHSLASLSKCFEHLSWLWHSSDWYAILHWKITCLDSSIAHSHWLLDHFLQVLIIIHTKCIINHILWLYNSIILPYQKAWLMWLYLMICI